jgi:hypothetical protein
MELAMMLELFVTVFVAAFVALVIFGHGLLFATILKCGRDDYLGGRDRRPRHVPRSQVDTTMVSAEMVSARRNLRT